VDPSGWKRERTDRFLNNLRQLRRGSCAKVVMEYVVKDSDPLQSRLDIVLSRLRSLSKTDQEKPLDPEARHLQSELENALDELDWVLNSQNTSQLRQLAYQAEQKSEELNAIFNSLVDAVIVYNQDGTVQRVNPVIHRLVEFEPAGLDLQTVLERIKIHHPDGRPLDVDDLPTSQALRGNIVRGMHQVITTPSGKKFHVLSTGSPLYTNGVFSGAVITWHDITERVNTERALLESEDRYRSLFHNNHTIMLVIDPSSGDIIDANPAACHFYGYSHAGITRLKITDINILSPEEVHQEMERARKESRNHFEFRHRLADGSLREVDVLSGPATINGKQYLYSIIHDDTSRRQAVAALARQVKINAAMAELSHELLSPTNLEDISERVLQHARQLTNSQFGFVAYIDPATGYLVSPTLSRDIWDACQVADKSAVFRSCKGLLGWVMENRKTLLTNNLQGDPSSTGTPPGHIPIQAYLGAPAVIGENILGMISLANPDRPYTPEDQDVVERLADLYGIALQRQQSDQALRQERDFISSILDTTGALVIVVDRQGRIVRFNCACETVSGYSFDEVRDRSFSFGMACQINNSEIAGEG
jgi:PAS domain S-box-containing protein